MSLKAQEDAASWGGACFPASGLSPAPSVRGAGPSICPESKSVSK